MIRQQHDEAKSTVSVKVKNKMTVRNNHMSKKFKGF